MEFNMFATLEFVMVACLFADLAFTRGAQVFAFLKSEFATVEKKV
jgi:hypothetical protein